MANELAAVMGELERIDSTLEELSARRARLLADRDSLLQVGSVVGLEQLRGFVPAVRVHRAYGGRGFLADWLRGLLQVAAPNWVDMRTLVALAEEKFGLDFPTYVQRDAYRKNTLGRALRKLLANGLVERAHDVGTTSMPGLWRWKGADRTQELLAAREAA